MFLASPDECRRFLATRNSEETANQLRADQESCRDGLLPTVLAHFVPSPGSKEGDKIAVHLSPSENVETTKEVRRLQYAGIVDGIKAYLAQMSYINDQSRDPINKPDVDKPYSSRRERISAESEATLVQGDATTDEVQDKGIESALKALHHLRAKGRLQNSDSLAFVLNVLQQEMKPSQHIPSQEGKSIRLKCYICRFVVRDPHPLYGSLCRACGAFNLAEGSLSLPESLNLTGRTAFISGGRINLGFHTALRLLRCGANVIVSTRYPGDAEARYRAVTDSEQWLSRVKIIGADFRTARDVFRLVHSVKTCLSEWAVAKDSLGTLFLLINNAAQTLTDPVEGERRAIALERTFAHPSIESSGVIVGNGYEPAIRGGSLMPGGLLESCDGMDIALSQPTRGYSSQKTEPEETQSDDAIGVVANGDHQLAVTNHTKSSWMQSLEEIPYEDIITAHSVNTFVPLILIRELLPTMSAGTKGPTHTPDAPAAHILNVSSREGIFENDIRSTEKAGRHVHTNMTKAGLNMITETEASRLWGERRIAMNTIDPGFMSAAPEMRKNQPPLSFDDGAARVLWSVAVVEGRNDKKLGPVWGRFLKHFGKQEVDVGLGR